MPPPSGRILVSSSMILVRHVKDTNLQEMSSTFVNSRLGEGATDPSSLTGGWNISLVYGQHFANSPMAYSQWACRKHSWRLPQDWSVFPSGGTSQLSACKARSWAVVVEFSVWRESDWDNNVSVRHTWCQFQGSLTAGSSGAELCWSDTRQTQLKEPLQAVNYFLVLRYSISLLP